MQKIAPLPVAPSPPPTLPALRPSQHVALARPSIGRAPVPSPRTSTPTPMPDKKGSLLGTIDMMHGTADKIEGPYTWSSMVFFDLGMMFGRIPRRFVRYLTTRMRRCAGTRAKKNHKNMLIGVASAPWLGGFFPASGQYGLKPGLCDLHRGRQDQVLALGRRQGPRCA